MGDRNFRAGTAVVVLFVLAVFVCTSGCSILAPPAPVPSGTSQDTPRPAIAQPEESADLITMRTDVYTIGDVVEFVLINSQKEAISCSGDPSGFSVQYQDGRGRWVIRLGPERFPDGNETRIDPGASVPPVRFVTGGWSPGRYRIVSSCGISHEILLRSPLPSTPAGTECREAANQTPYIRINSLNNPAAGDPFTLAGTTNLKPGEELRYSIFAITEGTGNVTSAKLVSSSIEVTPGRCGTNTWSVTGRIQVPGAYLFGISNRDNTVSAVKRFVVSEQESPRETATLPGTTKVPGITTGAGF